MVFPNLLFCVNNFLEETAFFDLQARDSYY